MTEHILYQVIHLITISEINLLLCFDHIFKCNDFWNWYMIRFYFLFLFKMWYLSPIMTTFPSLMTMIWSHKAWIKSTSWLTTTMILLRLFFNCFNNRINSFLSWSEYPIVGSSKKSIVDCRSKHWQEPLSSVLHDSKYQFFCSNT